MNVKSLKKLSVFGMLLFLLTGCISIPIGDGNKIKISKDGLTFTDGESGEHTISFDGDSQEIVIDDGEGGGGVISIDEDNDQIMMTGSNEDGEFINAFGENLDLPEDFPKDIPMIKDANIYHVLSHSGNMTVTYKTKMHRDETDKFYTDYVNSLKVSEEPNIDTSSGSDYLMKSFRIQRGDGFLMIRVAGSDEEDTDVSIMISDEEY